MTDSGVLAVAPEVLDALADGHPVVALESTLISQGLPRPGNLDVARSVEADVRSAGAVPATCAVLDGVARVGLTDDELVRVAGDPAMAKLSVRDLPLAVAGRRNGATTVSSTAALAATAGVQVFATGGLGGVHREARRTWDESADLDALARTAVVLVCSGIKSILDVPASLERLETLGVPVTGYRTDRFPGFYLTDSGCPLDWRLDGPAEVAAAWRALPALGLAGRALVVANPLPPDQQLDPAVHDEVLAAGLTAAEELGIGGKAVTPFLQSWFHDRTGGASLTANIELVRHNARLAAGIAAQLRSAGTAADRC